VNPDPVGSGMFFAADLKVDLSSLTFDMEMYCHIFANLPYTRK
jgi:hypothetical protein